MRVVIEARGSISKWSRSLDFGKGAVSFGSSSSMFLLSINSMLRSVIDYDIVFVGSVKAIGKAYAFCLNNGGSVCFNRDLFARYAL